MKRNVTKNEIGKIKSVSSRIPKSINEAINFNDDMYEDDDEMMGDEETPISNYEHEEDGDINMENFISTMRKQSLKIMSKLSDSPDNPIYEFAKKIFQLAEKAHQDEKEGKDINGQPQKPNNPNI
jgi:hypothetical protein